MRLQELSKVAKLNVDIHKLDENLKQECIDMSLELHYMGADERMAFITEESNFPKFEKAILLGTCIKLLEEMEDYEVCYTLHNMCEALNKIN